MGGIQEGVWLVVITTLHCMDKTRALNVNLKVRETEWAFEPGCNKYNYNIHFI